VRGFPIRTSTDRRLVDSSPWLIAVTHVLLRLQAPRHPPLALCSLENKDARARYGILKGRARPSLLLTRRLDGGREWSTSPKAVDFAEAATMSLPQNGTVRSDDHAFPDYGAGRATPSRGTDRTRLPPSLRERRITSDRLGVLDHNGRELTP
jgi:hypothetical protein